MSSTWEVGSVGQGGARAPGHDVTKQLHWFTAPPSAAYRTRLGYRRQKQRFAPSEQMMPTKRYAAKATHKEAQRTEDRPGRRPSNRFFSNLSSTTINRVCEKSPATGCDLETVNELWSWSRVSIISMATSITLPLTKANPNTYSLFRYHIHFLTIFIFADGKGRPSPQLRWNRWRTQRGGGYRVQTPHSIFGIFLNVSLHKDTVPLNPKFCTGKR